MMIKEALFQCSLSILKSIRQDLATPRVDAFFKVMSELGDKYAISLFVIYGYHNMDLAKAVTIALNAYSALALLSILKSINHEPRPFHVSDIKPTKCWYEYGNPSGHSLLTSSLYLTFWDMLCKQHKWERGSLARNLSLAIAIASSFLVAFSRIWHAVHTLNQILNGFIWGTALYVLYCDILYYELCRFVHSLNKMNRKRLLWNFGTRNFLVIYSLAIAMYIIGSIVHPEPQEWRDNVEKNCGPAPAHVTTDPELHNFERFNLCFSIIGVYLGVIVEQKYMGTHIYPYWN